MTDLDLRRRRALYRSQHRGTKEMDWLLGRYAEASLESMEEGALTRFEELLSLPDPELQNWIMSGDLPATSALHDLITTIRRYHGLGQ